MSFAKRSAAEGTEVTISLNCALDSSSGSSQQQPAAAAAAAVA